MIVMTVPPAPTGWPSSPSFASYPGLAGDFVRLVEPHSEADPMALLFQFLVSVGNAIGRGPYFRAERDRHHLNLFTVLVGDSAKARKGASWGYVRECVSRVDSTWATNCIASGLSSGEGVIHAVRDENGKDEGVTDKRLLVAESEFASTLRVLGRDGNTLSPLLRAAWDTGSLRTLTKNSPAKASGAHVSICGHITRPELRRYLTDTEAANGFGNRFLWCCARRSKMLPEGGSISEADFHGLCERLANVVKAARRVGEMRRDEAARQLWCDVYPRLSQDRLGLFGSMTARAEAQVVRLSCLFALLDGSEVVSKSHLESALAVWGYADESARFVFGETLGDPTADRILNALRSADDGMTRTEIGDLFKRHKSKTEIDAALELLVQRGVAYPTYEGTGGRHAERWFAERGAS